MRTRTRLVAITILLLVAGPAACDRSPVEAPAADSSPSLQAVVPGTATATAGVDLATARRATAPYQRIERAEADGFVPVSGCVASPFGGMGVHYGNPGRIEDPTIDPAEPELLLYEPGDDDRMRLVAVEFMVHEAAWYAAGHTDAPSVAGRTFDPPDPAHPDPELREFYTLHVWVWRDNPEGMFAHFNPKVGCG